MSEPERVRLPSGQDVWVRLAAPADGNGPVDVARRTDRAAPLSLEGFREAVRGVAASVQESLEAFEPRPAEVGVEFGIEIDVRAGKAIAVVADAGARTSVKVSLTWNPE